MSNFVLMSVEEAIVELMVELTRVLILASVGLTVWLQYAEIFQFTRRSLFVCYGYCGFQVSDVYCPFTSESKVIWTKDIQIILE